MCQQRNIFHKGLAAHDLVVVDASETLRDGDMLEQENDGRDRDEGAKTAHEVRVDSLGAAHVLESGGNGLEDRDVVLGDLLVSATFKKRQRPRSVSS